MAFQDYFPGNLCEGCGPKNKTGKRIKSYWVTDKRLETICSWKMKKRYSAASENVLHGGCSASLMDCHSIWTAIAARYDLEKLPFGSSAIWYETAAMHFQLLKHIPIDAGILTIIARVEELKQHSRKCVVFSEIIVRGICCAEALIVGIRVDRTQEQLSLLLQK